jgi:type II secretion system protein G
MNRAVFLGVAIVLLGALISPAQDAPPATQPATHPATQPAGSLLDLFNPSRKITAAKADLANLKTAMTVFEIDNGRFPTTGEGLQALVKNPANLPDWHAALDKVPLDPWGNPYIYRCPGTNGNDFDMYSTGPNGRDDHGGGDDIN